MEMSVHEDETITMLLLYQCHKVLVLQKIFFKIRLPKIKVHNIDKSNCNPILRCFLNIKQTAPMASHNHPSSPSDVINNIILSKMGLCISCNAYKILNSQFITIPLVLEVFLIYFKITICSYHT